MPTVDHSAPRRPTVGRSKSYNRPHSRSSSQSSAGNRNNGLGFTTIGPTPTTSVSGKERSSSKHSRRKSGGGSAKATSPHRQSPPPRPSLSRHGSSAKVPTQTLQIAVNEDDDEWESSESGAVTPNPEPTQQTTPVVQQSNPFSPPGPSTLTPRLSSRPFPSSQDIDDQPISPTNTETQTHHRSNRSHSRAQSTHSMRSANRLPLLGQAAVASASIARVPSYTSPPLTAPPYLSAQSAQAQIATSPPQTPSPPPSPNTLSQFIRPEPNNPRKASFSSTHSASTLPVPKSTIYNLQNEKRQRTISALSPVSSSAALSSLAAIPAAQNRHYNSSFRPPTPPLVSRFPPHPVDEIHPFLPQGYMGIHYSVTQFYDPLRESFARVAEAKVTSRLR
ncbi:hypothetical protein FRC03_006211 [Tulasnella sp. 419]|nr:hypothetical protein FRC02_011433 [Tulasnella sp. 418]KAG8968755.1 hypothetical protein FRC03_006211 [Tulasnella sp. 419]